MDDDGGGEGLGEDEGRCNSGRAANTEGRQFGSSEERIQEGGEATDLSTFIKQNLSLYDPSVRILISLAKKNTPV